MEIKRRDFLKYIAGSAALPSSFLSAFTLFEKKSLPMNMQKGFGRVVVIKRPEAFTASDSVSSEAVYRMISDAVCRLTGHTAPADAWLSLFSPSEKIGIKVNGMGGRKICTHHEVAYAVAKHLTACGIPARNIILWDRLSPELEKGGYAIQKGGSSVQCYGTDSDYEAEPEISGSIGSCFSRILARQCDALINIPVLKDHDLSGVSLSLKNFYGAIHNPNKYHENGCDPFIADLNNHPHIKNKLRLVIIDGLTAQCNGGPSYKPQWSWPYSGLILSRDPVAADAVGAQILNDQRKLKGLPSLRESGRDPVHIQTAAKTGLGVAEADKIETILL